MGVRREKGLALTRYMTGASGIPGLMWGGSVNEIVAPAPYIIGVTTSRKLQDWHDAIRNSVPNKPHMHIRYDRGMDSPADAWVAMTLHNFIPLLTAHYDTQRERVEGE